jgi:hypothetical protein
MDAHRPEGSGLHADFTFRITTIKTPAQFPPASFEQKGGGAMANFTGKANELERIA